MKVVLRDDVESLGHKGDLVDVADGYARNFLVPRGLAMKATKGVVAQAEAMRRNRDRARRARAGSRRGDRRPPRRPAHRGHGPCRRGRQALRLGHVRRRRRRGRGRGRGRDRSPHDHARRAAQGARRGRGAGAPPPRRDRDRHRRGRRRVARPAARRPRREAPGHARGLSRRPGWLSHPPRMMSLDPRARETAGERVFHRPGDDKSAFAHSEIALSIHSPDVSR